MTILDVGLELDYLSELGHKISVHEQQVHRDSRDLWKFNHDTADAIRNINEQLRELRTMIHELRDGR